MDVALRYPLCKGTLSVEIFAFFDLEINSDACNTDSCNRKLTGNGVGDKN